MFCEHEITAEVLPNLSADDLKDLGIAAVGHRRRLLDAIALLRVGNEPVGVRVSASHKLSDNPLPSVGSSP